MLDPEHYRQNCREYCTTFFLWILSKVCKFGKGSPACLSFLLSINLSTRKWDASSGVNPWFDKQADLIRKFFSAEFKQLIQMYPLVHRDVYEWI
jgi:hypothetical protein